MTPDLLQSDVSSSHHFTTFPFALRDGLSGGLPSVLMAEAKNSGGLTILSTDKDSGNWEGARLVAADPDTDLTGARFPKWFNIDWALLHPDAYTEVSTSLAALEAMYGHIPSDHAMGSLERMLEYCEKFGGDADIESSFNRRFDRAIGNINPGAFMNWQDYFFGPAINQHADELRTKGVYQTWHLHTTLPASLQLSPWGRDLLSAMSKVDVLYVHTDEYARRVELQLEQLHLKCPNICRFDLGIDEITMGRGLANINASNYETSFPNFHLLKPEQLELIREVFHSQGTVKHRFFCLDRADPGKGVITVLDGVRHFLRDLRQNGMSLEDLQRDYRFFFLHQLYGMAPLDNQNLAHSYILHVRERHTALQKDFPGVVFVSDAVRGDQRSLVPALLRGCHGITGGAQDGLNLSIQENAWVNKDQDTAVISGSGAGFSIQAQAQGFGENGYFPQAGDATAFCNAIANIVRTKESSPGTLGERKLLLANYIASRRARVIADRT